MTPSLRLGGRYLLETRIGQGGMSEVWRARDEVLARPVAIKVLAGPWLAGPDARAMIRNEALSAAQLSHPNIASVYDFGEDHDEHGQPVAYIVLELLAGDPLPDLLAAGPLPAAVAARIATDVAAALGAAHAYGLVHRDVKPGNIIVTPFGAKVFDFGIAATAGEPDRRDELGRILGTAVFVSPERLTGAPVTPASDMYAFGVLLRRLFGPFAPSDVERLSRRCLAADSATRPTAVQAYETLSRVLAAGDPTPAPRPVGVATVGPGPDPALPATAYFEPPTRRFGRRSLAAAAALLVTLGLATMALAARAGGDPPVVAQFAPVPTTTPPPPPPPAAAPAPAPIPGSAGKAGKAGQPGKAGKAATSVRCDAAEAYARMLSRLSDELRKGRNGRGGGKSTTYSVTCSNGVPLISSDR